MERATIAPIVQNQPHDESSTVTTTPHGQPAVVYFEAGWNSLGSRSFSVTRQTGHSWMYPGNSMSVYFTPLSFRTCFTTLCVSCSVSAVPIEMYSSRSLSFALAVELRQEGGELRRDRGTW